MNNTMIDIVLINKDKEGILEFSKNLGFYDIYFLEEKDIYQSVNKIKKENLVIFDGDDESNRKALESGKINILLNPGFESKDTLKNINSGLNQVLCKIANKKNVAIAFSLDKIKEQKVIKKIIQNIKLCRKYKVKILLFTFAKNKYEMRHANDLISFCKILGMTPGESKFALNGLKDILKRKANI